MAVRRSENMPLRNQAARLVNVLLKVVDELDSYTQHERSEYTRTLVDRLRPLAASFEQAVLRDRSRNAAGTELAAAAQERLGARCLLGCPGEAIVGDDREIEDGPAMSLWLGRWDQPVTLTPFHLTLEQTSEGPDLLGWPDVLTGLDPQQAFVLMLADPFTFPVDAFLRQINEEHPGLRVMGGMASGGRHAGQNAMLLGDRCVRQGAVGVVVQGPILVRSI